MSSEWNVTTWGELVTLEYGKAIRDYQKFTNGYRVYGTNGPIGWHDKPLCTFPSVIIGRKGAYRGVHYSENPFFVIDTAFYVKPKNELDTRWAYYCLLTYDINGMDSGSAIPSTNREEFYKLPVNVPPVNEQFQIATFLKLLDDRITLLRETNVTLESIAQALFKSWFVDFDPVKAKIVAKQEGRDLVRAAMSAISGRTGAELDSLPPEQYDQLAATAALFPDEMEDSELGKIPRGWVVKALGEFITIKRGGSPRPIQEFMAPSGLPWVKIADATAEASPFLFETREFIKESGLKKTVHLKSGALILTNSATPGLPKFLELDACIHDGWLYFPEKRLFTDQYLYFLFQKIRSELVAKGNGSVFTNLKTDILREQRVLVPAHETMTSFTISARLILENIKALAKEGVYLASLRDTLLPRLISGQLRLPEAESAMEAVLA